MKLHEIPYACGHGFYSAWVTGGPKKRNIRCPKCKGALRPAARGPLVNDNYTIEKRSFDGIAYAEHWMRVRVNDHVVSYGCMPAARIAWAKMAKVYGKNAVRIERINLSSYGERP